MEAAYSFKNFSNEPADFMVVSQISMEISTAVKTWPPHVFNTVIPHGGTVRPYQHDAICSVLDTTKEGKKRSWLCGR
jgi:hypothetical protein